MKKIDDAEIAGLADPSAFVHHGAQRLRYRGPGVEKIDIDAARTIMTGSHRLGDLSVFACPAHAPIVHGADALGPFLAQQLRKGFVAKSAPGGERIVVMMSSNGQEFQSRARQQRSSGPSPLRRRGRSSCGRREAPDSRCVPPQSPHTCLRRPTRSPERRFQRASGLGP